MKARYDAVIVGGGHNGLVCACYLAAAGMSVGVFERRHVLGGAAVPEALGQHAARVRVLLDDQHAKAVEPHLDRGRVGRHARGLVVLDRLVRSVG